MLSFIRSLCILHTSPNYIFLGSTEDKALSFFTGVLCILYLIGAISPHVGCLLGVKCLTYIALFLFDSETSIPVLERKIWGSKRCNTLPKDIDLTNNGKVILIHSVWSQSPCFALYSTQSHCQILVISKPWLKYYWPEGWMWWSDSPYVIFTRGLCRKKEVWSSFIQGIFIKIPNPID